MSSRLEFQLQSAKQAIFALLVLLITTYLMPSLDRPKYMLRLAMSHSQQYQGRQRLEDQFGKDGEGVVEVPWEQKEWRGGERTVCCEL